MIFRGTYAVATDIKYFDDYFSVANARYDHSSVDHIKFDHKATRWKLYGVVDSGTSHSAVLDVYIRNHHDPIKVRFRGAIFRATSFTYDKQDVEALVNCSQELRKRTFAARKQKYVDQINSDGYFLYEKMRFAKDLRVYTDTGTFLFDLTKCFHYQSYNVRRWVDKDLAAERVRWSAFKRYTSVLRGWHEISTAFDSEVLDELILDLYRNYQG